MSSRKYYLYITPCLMVMLIEVCAQDFSQYLRNVRNCLYGNDSVDCIKEETVDILNETVYSEEPITLFNSIDIVRNKGYIPEYSEEFSMGKSSQRSVGLSDVIFNRIEEFFKSRTVQFRIGDSIGEARKKSGFGGLGGGGGGKKGGGGGMLILIGVAMAGMMAQVFMGKLALAAGAALLLSKLALMISLVSSFKKSSGDGGGKESAHVVYASTGGDSHGHGGWHRSLMYEEDPQNLAYNGYTQ